MASLDVDFEWWHDGKGYALLPAEEPLPGPSSSAFGWCPPKPQRVVRLGGDGDLRPCRPLEHFEKLFQQFIKRATSAEGVLDFIENFGPLTGSGLEPSVGESVSNVIQHAERMRLILRAHSLEGGIALTRVLRDRPINLGAIETALIADPITGGLRMRLSVPDLLTGLWVQFGQSLASGAAMRTCEHCNMPFEVGPGTSRRLDAKFCSDDHRVAFNSLKRSKGAKANA